MDWLTLLILDLIEFGLAPEVDYTFKIMPVDRMSKAIVRLGESENTMKAIINLPPTHAITFKSIWTEICRQRQMEPHYLKVTDWCRKLDERLKTAPQSLYALQLFSNILVNSPSGDISNTIDDETDLNLPMFVEALLRS